jgi:hypothetical protein
MNFKEQVEALSLLESSLAFFEKKILETTKEKEKVCSDIATKLYTDTTLRVKRNGSNYIKVGEHILLFDTITPPADCLKILTESITVIKATECDLE